MAHCSLESTSSYDRSYGVPIVSGQSGKVVSSYGPTNQDTTFDQIKAARMAVKAERAQEHMELLNSRYDLAEKDHCRDVMSGGKPIPVGPTAKLQGTSGSNWTS